MRGFVAIGLQNPKYPHNVGSVFRAAGCYNADLIVIGGRRLCNYQKLSADTMKAWRHIPTVICEDLFSAMPLGAIPVCVEILPDAVPLPNFVHPERAFYIFGPEDGSLGSAIHKRCPYKISIPTTHCMNLAATVNVVLYDRMAKDMKPSFGKYYANSQTNHASQKN